MTIGCPTFLRSQEMGGASLACTVHGLAKQRKITKVIVASLACTVHGLGTQEIERSSMNHMDDVIGMMAYLENILMAVTIGGGIVLKDRVIT